MSCPKHPHDIPLWPTLPTRGDSATLSPTHGLKVMFRNTLSVITWEMLQTEHPFPTERERETETETERQRERGLTGPNISNTEIEK